MSNNEICIIEPSEGVSTPRSKNLNKLMYLTGRQNSLEKIAVLIVQTKSQDEAKKNAILLKKNEKLTKILEPLSSIQVPCNKKLFEKLVNQKSIFYNGLKNLNIQLYGGFDIEFLQTYRNQILELSNIHVTIKNDEHDLQFFDFIRESTRLKELTIGLCCIENHVTIPKGSIPQSVEKLRINTNVELYDYGYVFKKEDGIMKTMRTVLEEGTIPNSVKTLEIDHLLFDHYPKRIIPDSVEKLIVDSFCLVYQDSNSDNSECSDNNIINIPSSVKSLQFIDSSWECVFTDHIPPIPSGITEITDKNVISAGAIPSSLETLDLTLYQYPTQIFIPPSVKLIKICIPCGTTQTYLDSLLQLSTDLLSFSNSIRELHFKNVYSWETKYILLSIDPSDPYVYFSSISIYDGFALKSDIPKLITYLNNPRNNI
eukprot:gene9093-11144_t